MMPRMIGPHQVELRGSMAKLTTWQRQGFRLANEARTRVSSTVLGALRNAWHGFTPPTGLLKVTCTDIAETE